MSVKVGDKLVGTVAGIKSFGAFVSLPNHETGLVHISEVSDGFVKDIHDVLKDGDKVNVVVTKVAPDGKIALSIKKANSKTNATSPNPVRNHNQGQSFDKMLSNFMKESDSRWSEVKKNTEGKRGGRGGRRT